MLFVRFMLHFLHFHVSCTLTSSYIQKWEYNIKTVTNSNQCIQ